VPIRYIASTVDLKARYLSPSGQRCENVYQYKYDLVPDSAQLAAFAAAWAATTIDNWRAILPIGCRLVEVAVKDVGALDGSGAQGVYTYPTPTFGLVTLPPQASQVACRVQLNTGRSGDSFRGAKAVSPFWDEAVDGDQFVSSLITLVMNFALQWLVSYIVGGITYIPAVGSPALNKSELITSVSIIDPYTDSQKTRAVKHGD